MKTKLPIWFRSKHRRVMLTGQDIINLRSDVDNLKTVLEGMNDERLLSLREDVNAALSAAAKGIYKLEALEERMTAAEEKVKHHLGDGKTSH